MTSSLAASGADSPGREEMQIVEDTVCTRAEDVLRPEDGENKKWEYLKSHESRV